MHIYISTHRHAHTHSIDKYTCVYIHRDRHKCTHRYMYTHTDTCIDIHTCSHTCIQHTEIGTYLGTHKHTDTHINIYTHHTYRHANCFLGLGWGQPLLPPLPHLQLGITQAPPQVEDHWSGLTKTLGRRVGPAARQPWAGTGFGLGIR